LGKVGGNFRGGGEKENPPEILNFWGGKFLFWGKKRKFFKPPKKLGALFFKKGLN